MHSPSVSSCTAIATGATNAVNSLWPELARWKIDHFLDLVSKTRRLGFSFCPGKDLLAHRCQAFIRDIRYAKDNFGPRLDIACTDWARLNVGDGRDAAMGQRKMLEVEHDFRRTDETVTPSTHIIRVGMPIDASKGHLIVVDALPAFDPSDGLSSLLELGLLLNVDLKVR